MISLFQKFLKSLLITLHQKEDRKNIMIKQKIPLINKQFKEELQIMNSLLEEDFNLEEHITNSKIDLVLLIQNNLNNRLIKMKN